MQEILGEGEPETVTAEVEEAPVKKAATRKKKTAETAESVEAEAAPKKTRKASAKTGE
jgi:hypothetical protein